jgi:stage II sporulation protein AB (anti-sigma F factor)
MIEIRDKGCGISDVKKAMTPLFTTDKSGERSGMGFAVMQTFTDKLEVISKVDHGVRILMSKQLC